VNVLSQSLLSVPFDTQLSLRPHGSNLSFVESTVGSTMTFGFFGLATVSALEVTVVNCMHLLVSDRPFFLTETSSLPRLISCDPSAHHSPPSPVTFFFTCDQISLSFTLSLFFVALIYFCVTVPANFFPGCIARRKCGPHRFP